MGRYSVLRPPACPTSGGNTGPSPWDALRKAYVRRVLRCRATFQLPAGLGVIDGQDLNLLRPGQFPRRRGFWVGQVEAPHPFEAVHGEASGPYRGFATFSPANKGLLHQMFASYVYLAGTIRARWARPIPSCFLCRAPRTSGALAETIQTQSSLPPSSLRASGNRESKGTTMTVAHLSPARAAPPPWPELRPVQSVLSWQGSSLPLPAPPHVASAAVISEGR